MATAKKSIRMILTLGYTKYIISADAAALLVNMFSEGGVEEYSQQYEDGKNRPRVKPTEMAGLSLMWLSDEEYALGKLLQAADDNINQGEAK